MVCYPPPQSGMLQVLTKRRTGVLTVIPRDTATKTGAVLAGVFTAITTIKFAFRDVVFRIAQPISNVSYRSFAANDTYAPAAATGGEIVVGGTAIGGVVDVDDGGYVDDGVSGCVESAGVGTTLDAHHGCTPCKKRPETTFSSCRHMAIPERTLL